MTEKKLSTLVINQVESIDVYNLLKTQGKINQDELYLISGEADTITGVKGNKETTYRTGNVNLTPADIGALPMAGGTVTGALTVEGNVTGNYITGSWLQTTANTALNSIPTKIAVLNDGLIYSRTPAQIKSDIGLGNVDNVKLPSVTTADNGKFLQVVNGAWAAVEITNANGGSF